MLVFVKKRCSPYALFYPSLFWCKPPELYLSSLGGFTFYYLSVACAAVHYELQKLLYKLFRTHFIKCFEVYIFTSVKYR